MSVSQFTNPRKRNAQPLSTTRTSKHPRLAAYNGGAASQPGGIGSRWKTFLVEGAGLVGDTIASILPSMSYTPQIEENDSDTAEERCFPSADLFLSPNSTPRHSSLTEYDSSPPSKSGTYIPPSFPSASQSHLEENTLSATYNKIKYAQSPENIPLPPSPLKFDDQHANSAVSIPLRSAFNLEPTGQSTPRNADRFASSTSVPFHPPTPTSEKTHFLSSTDSVLQGQVESDLRNLHLGSSLGPSFATSSQTSKSESVLNFGSQTTGRSSRSSRRDPLRRNDRKRVHVKQNAYKAKVKRERGIIRDQIMRQIYEAKQKQGFKSNIADLEGFLNYQFQLQEFNIESPHPRLRRSQLLGQKTVQSDLSEILPNKDAFLQRALHKAQATFQSPKPPPPFTPTFEQMRIFQRRKDDDIENRIRPPKIPFPSKLPPEDEKKVDQVLRMRGFVSKFAREQVSQSDLTRLLPGQWLNDEIINFYGAMLLGRSENKENSGNGKKALNIHYFSSFFWTKLVNEGYDKGRLSKWTKKIDIFSKDIVFMPVNHGNAHWTAAAINFRNKRFESYDSMGMAKASVFNKLRDYVKAEHQTKKKKDFDFTGWIDWAPADLPQQENGYDCGVFTCQFMEALSRGEEICFEQENMPYFRRMMIWEIANTKLRDDR